MTGTTESVKYMSQLIVSGEVDGLEADMWLTTLSFIQQPTREMLSEVKVLLHFLYNVIVIQLPINKCVLVFGLLLFLS